MKQALENAARAAGVTAQVAGEAPVFEIYFTDRPITDYRATLTADAELHAAYTRELLERGILKAAQKFTYRSPTERRRSAAPSRSSTRRSGRRIAERPIPDRRNHS